MIWAHQLDPSQRPSSLNLCNFNWVTGALFIAYECTYNLWTMFSRFLSYILSYIYTLHSAHIKLNISFKTHIYPATGRQFQLQSEHTLTLSYKQKQDICIFIVTCEEGLGPSSKDHAWISNYSKLSAGLGWSHSCSPWELSKVLQYRFWSAACKLLPAIEDLLLAPYSASRCQFPSVPGQVFPDFAQRPAGTQPG